LQRRVPTRGFTNIFREEVEIVNLATLDSFETGATVDMESLKRSGAIRSRARIVKILGNGELTKKLNVKAHRFSKSAKEKIEAKGGTAEVIAAAAAAQA
jgi:large subunit ribosomal protein L15